jgi:hypothetical protein
VCECDEEIKLCEEMRLDKNKNGARTVFKQCKHCYLIRNKQNAHVHASNIIQLHCNLVIQKTHVLTGIYRSQR